MSKCNALPLLTISLVAHEFHIEKAIRLLRRAPSWLFLGREGKAIQTSHESPIDISRSISTKRSERVDPLSQVREVYEICLEKLTISGPLTYSHRFCLWIHHSSLSLTILVVRRKIQWLEEVVIHYGLVNWY